MTSSNEKPPLIAEELAILCSCEIARKYHGIAVMCFYCPGPIGLEKAKARIEQLNLNAGVTQDNTHLTAEAQEMREQTIRKWTSGLVPYGMIPAGTGNVVLEARVRFRSEFPPPYNSFEHIKFRFNESTWSPRNLAEMLQESADPGKHVSVVVVSIDGQPFDAPPSAIERLRSELEKAASATDEVEMLGHILEAQDALEEMRGS